MVIYRVNILIEKEKEDDWKKWMTETHIIDVLDTGHFESFSFSKLINSYNHDQDKYDMNKYSAYEIRYVCKNMEELKAYENNGASKLREEHSKKYGQYTQAKRDVFLDITESQFLEKRQA